MKPAIKTKQYFCKEKKFEIKNCRIIFSIKFLIKILLIKGALSLK